LAASGIQILKRPCFSWSKAFLSWTLSGRPDDDFAGLRPFGTLYKVVLDHLPSFQGFETFHVDGRIMDKNILTISLFDKPETFIIVKPFNRTRFHSSLPPCRVILSCCSISVQGAAPAKKKAFGFTARFPAEAPLTDTNDCRPIFPPPPSPPSNKRYAE